MKRGIRSAARAAAVVVALAACQKQSKPEEAAGTAVQSLAAIVATCASAVGDVQVKRAGQAAWEPVATGATFRAGDEVRTAPLAFVRVEFLTGGGLELEEKASVVIDVAPPEKGAPDSSVAGHENRVAVKEGVVRGFLPQATEGVEPLGIVIQSSDGSHTRLAAKAGEKPAAFRLTGSRKGTELAVTQGEARVVTAKGEKAIRRGQAVEVAQGEVSAPAELIDFPPSLEPGIDARFHFVPGLSVKLTWRAVPGAAGYRVQVARDLAFQGIDQVSDVSGTEFAFAAKGPGMNAWRVAAKDASGRYGEYGFARRFYAEKDLPRDLLVAPADGAVLKFTDAPPPVSFSWESAGAAQKYRLVVASGPNLLDQKVMGTVAQGQRVDLEGLGAGDYFWGVYVDDGKTPEPIFVKPRRLSIQKLAKPKVKVPKALSEWGK